MTERPVSIEIIKEAEGVLIKDISIPTIESAKESWIQTLAEKAAGNVVALRVISIESEETDPDTPFVWIDGEILTGEDLRHSFSDPDKSPQLSEHVVIARTGTIFTAHSNDSVISSKPPTTA